MNINFMLSDHNCGGYYKKDIFYLILYNKCDNIQSCWLSSIGRATES